MNRILALAAALFAWPAAADEALKPAELLAAEQRGLLR